MILKLATAGDLDALRGLIAEFYYTTPEKITLDAGAVYNNGKKLNTSFFKKGKRFYFVKEVAPWK